MDAPGIPFKPGNQAAKGRGPNKVSTKVKEAIVNFLENNVDKIQESFDTLKPRERLQFIADLLPYAAPKMTSNENNNVHSGDVTVTLYLNGDKLPKTLDS